MKLFDLHCDTITTCKTDNKSLLDSENDITLCKAKCLDKWIQVFAIWMPDEYRGEAAESYFEGVYQTFNSEMRQNTAMIEQCRSFSDIKYCEENGKAAAILSLEGASALNGKIDRVDLMHSLGVKLITLTWNGENKLGFGCQTEKEDGLTEFGKSVIRRMEKLKMAVDVSHLNQGGFWDVAREIESPFIASHSNSARVLRGCRAGGEDCRRSVIRNLEDEQIKVIVERGGLIGLNFCDSFLGDKGDDGFEAILRNVDHILSLGGEKVLALGSDYDGCNINEELCGIDKMPALNSFLANNVGKELTEDIFYNNAFNFFKNIL